MTEQEEKKNKKKAAIISVFIHSILLLAFLFIIAWREPDPPLPEYGIELNFGLDNVGSGEIQPETTANNNTSEEEAAPEELPEQSETAVENSESVEEVETAEEVVEEATTSTHESPDVVKKTTVEDKVQPVKEEKKEVVKEVKKTEEKKEVVNKPETGAKGTTGESTKPQEANHGDDVNKVGDKGNEQGTLDSRALYGNPGGGGGSALEMTGWVWDFKPKPNDTSTENGRIVFEIKIDDQGEILSVRTLERSVSPAVEKIYRSEVEKLTFSKTSDNSMVAPVSTGKITFVIKSK